MFKLTIFALFHTIWFDYGYCTACRRCYKWKKISKHDRLDFFITCNLQELCEAANHIRAELCGNKIDICTIINGKSGACSENCRFCTQSALSHSACTVHRFLPIKNIVEEAALNVQSVFRL